jgi:hypothetical protein
MGDTEAGRLVLPLRPTLPTRKEREMPDAALDKRSRASSVRWADAKRCTGYAVYDPVGQKIGSAEEVFVNRDGGPVYVRVNTGFIFSRTVLIPVQFVERDEERKTLVPK